MDEKLISFNFFLFLLKIKKSWQILISENFQTHNYYLLDFQKFHKNKTSRVSKHFKFSKFLRYLISNKQFNGVWKIIFSKNLNYKNRYNGSRYQLN